MFQPGPAQQGQSQGNPQNLSFLYENSFNDMLYLCSMHEYLKEQSAFSLYNRILYFSYEIDLIF
jgi:hypothetical protein